MTVSWNEFSPADRAVLCFLRDRSSSEAPSILLIEKKRGLGAGKVNAPGGKLDPGETPRDAAIRETEEEVGLVPEELTHHGVLRFIFTNGYHLEVHVFLSYRWRGTLTETDEAAPFWVAESDIPYERMWEDDRLWLPSVLRDRIVDAEMLFDDDHIVTWDIRFSDGERLVGSSAVA